ncbi:hypothetical protein GQ53DRAFT_831048 [Thozetella sp. PMI_491]|nr:hypothetical protein GQ53DRAFT_831048 [Thozetella sp. PMI_491]
MASLFDWLPHELIATVCEHLDAASLGSMRLVSQSCKAGFEPFFLRLFGTLHVDLDVSGLSYLSVLAENREISRSIRVLHLTCLSYQDPPGRNPNSPGGERSNATGYDARLPLFPQSVAPWFAEIEHPRAWMKNKKAKQIAFSGSAMCEQLSWALERLNSLDTVTLEGAVICGQRPDQRCRPDIAQDVLWRDLWARAVQAFRIVLSAASRSHVHLRRLGLFEASRKCSIPTNEVTSSLLSRLEDEGFEAVGQGLEHLAISLATTTVPIRMEGKEEPNFHEPFDISAGKKLHLTDAMIETEFNEITRLFLMTPNLQSLDLRLYNTIETSTRIPRQRPYLSFLSSLFQGLVFSGLTSLTLQCMPASPETLVDIARKHSRLRSIALKHIFLIEGSWGPILQSIVEGCVLLNSVHLSNLWRSDGEGVTHLEGRGSLAQRPDFRRDWFIHGGPRGYIRHTRDFMEHEFPEMIAIDSDIQPQEGWTPMRADLDPWWFDHVSAEHGPP